MHSITNVIVYIVCWSSIYRPFLHSA